MQGFCGYRTRLLPEGSAQRFARCLQGNRLFRDVAVRSSRTARDPQCRHYVVWRPASPERAAQLQRSAQMTRAERAVAQAANYEFWPDPDVPGLYWCLNLTSFEVYETTKGSCTCGDRHHRGEREGVACKHMLMLAARLAPPAPAAPERTALMERELAHLGSRATPDYVEIRARMAQDFPDF